MACHCIIIYYVYEFYGKAGADLISDGIVRQNLEKKPKVPSPNPAPQAIVDWFDRHQSSVQHRKGGFW